MKKTVIFFLFFLALGFQSGFCEGDGRVSPRLDQGLSDINVEGLIQEEAKLIFPPPLKEKDSEVGKKDPFWLPGRKNPEELAPRFGEWQLTAIILKNNRGLAIINGTILREGDSIEGVRVQKILKDRVFLSQGGAKVEVKISPFGEE
ncbi:MAG TPA: hypothetical protein VGB26_13045 [Nitrospiria bacterium]